MELFQDCTGGTLFATVESEHSLCNCTFHAEQGGMLLLWRKRPYYWVEAFVDVLSFCTLAPFQELLVREACIDRQQGITDIAWQVIMMLWRGFISGNSSILLAPRDFPCGAKRMVGLRISRSDNTMPLPLFAFFQCRPRATSTPIHSTLWA